MSSLYVIPNLGLLEMPVIHPADFGAAEAFDDEPFSMNVTVDEAAAVTSTDAATVCDPWAWAS